MVICKAMALQDQTTMRQNTSSHYVYYDSARNKMISKVLLTQIGKRPIYKFFIDEDNHYFPLRCMLDMGITAFVISLNTAKAFKIPVVKRTIKVKSKGVTGQEILTEGQYTIPLELSFRYHRSYNIDDHAFVVMPTSQEYNWVIPVWYREKHKALGTTTSRLHFPHWGTQCYGHENIYPEYSITYDI